MCLPACLPASLPACLPAVPMWLQGMKERLKALEGNLDTTLASAPPVAPETARRMAALDRERKRDEGREDTSEYQDDEVRRAGHEM